MLYTVKASVREKYKFTSEEPVEGKNRVVSAEQLKRVDDVPPTPEDKTSREEDNAAKRGKKRKKGNNNKADQKKGKGKQGKTKMGKQKRKRKGTHKELDKGTMDSEDDKERNDTGNDDDESITSNPKELLANLKEMLGEDSDGEFGSFDKDDDNMLFGYELKDNENDTEGTKKAKEIRRRQLQEASAKPETPCEKRTDERPPWPDRNQDDKKFPQENAKYFQDKNYPRKDKKPLRQLIPFKRDGTCLVDFPTIEDIL